VFLEKHSEYFVGTPVSLVLQTSELEGDLRGTGLVRWVRKTSQGALTEGSGIEFTYLDKKSRSLLQGYLNTHSIRAFIPDHP